MCCIQYSRYNYTDIFVSGLMMPWCHLIFEDYFSALVGVIVLLHVTVIVFIVCTYTYDIRGSIL